MTEPFLSVRDLTVEIATEEGLARAVDGLSFDLARGSTLGIVGESGSGKTATALALMRLHDPAQVRLTGQIWLTGHDLVRLGDPAMRRFRGNRIAMIFQDPLTALSPFHTIGRQIAEVYRTHQGAGRRQARSRAVELLHRVGFPHPATSVDRYPHELSGGMRQRAMIAMALVCEPDLLIADEPTTALDVTVQAQIIELLQDLQRQSGMAIILITHDLGVVAGATDEVLVMYAGRVVERGPAGAVFERPRHPYTWALLSAAPRLSPTAPERLTPVRGTPPSPLDLPTGCPFHPRCDVRELAGPELCLRRRPPAVPPEVEHGDSCHLALRHRRERRAAT